MTDILLIDDSEFDRRLVLMLLENESSWNATGCRSGEEALRLLKEQSFDLVITDLKMPKMDGLEVIRAIRRRHETLPVILITSHGNEDTALLALQQGAANYIPKRWLASRLQESVDTVLCAANRDRQRGDTASHVKSQLIQLELPSDRSVVPGVISWMQDLATSHGLLDSSNAVRLGVALEEALLNAIIHGNLEVSSELREGDGLLFEEFIALHMTQERYRNRKVHFEARFDQHYASFRIQDEGPGFDITQVPDPTEPENLLRPSGRGLLLIQAFMDEVEFNDQGNCITLTRRRTCPVPNSAEPSSMEPVTLEKLECQPMLST